MPISYSPENKAWDLTQITQEETNLLVNLGKDFLLQVLGYQILKKYQEQSEDLDLNAIDAKHMGNA